MIVSFSFGKQRKFKVPACEERHTALLAAGEYQRHFSMRHLGRKADLAFSRRWQYCDSRATFSQDLQKVQKESMFCRQQQGSNFCTSF
jgi:hypothetical protein